MEPAIFAGSYVTHESLTVYYYQTHICIVLLLNMGHAWSLDQHYQA